ncbi:putative metallophosphoesterase At3g03305 isoform X2 [Magnolia sinica]|nr:putative metallophosphoesterase At3g03305 isoform X2 [Magnolia sinica]
MKQDENEWVEYRSVMEDVIERSGLDKKIFYDLRGNHDNFGVSTVGGMFDFFQKYSINADLRRSGNVHSVTLQGSGWKHLFVGFDSTMGVGLRGPTNLFGHPTDQLLADLDSELSQWDSQPITKISFGHFPLSFSTASDSGKSLKDVFFKHSLSAYIFGHLHTKFGKNLKRHHVMGHRFLSSEEYFQLNIHQETLESTAGGNNCSNKATPIKEFWEWEMGDWRMSRIMRILAIDAGHVSFVDVDFKSGAKKTIVLPTFPLDSRFMQRISFRNEYNCLTMNVASYETVRALVFSEPEIVSVVVKIYDSRPGTLNLVLEASMKKHEGNRTRGDLYTIPWNWRAFVDPSPDRFWLQIEAIDFSGGSSFSELRPFSINGLTMKINWRWKEFLVMGCHWDALYHPILWSILLFLFSLLLIPKAFLLVSKKHYSYKDLSSDFKVGSVTKCLVSGLCGVLVEISKITSIWSGMLIYLLYLTFFPWFFGQVFTESGSMGYMTHGGWTVKIPNNSGKQSHIGVPDVMVIVLPHLCFVVLPAFLVSAGLAAEKAAYRVHYLSQSGKKEDDYERQIKTHVRNRWMRKLLLMVCLPILWKHWKHCWALTKAYEMNPFLHSAAYCLPVPLLLAHSIHKTKGAQIQ